MAKKSSYTGLAGEFRVMSELLLRGHNPAKSYLEDGADLILENGKRIEVKSCHRYISKSRQGSKEPRYLFSFRGGNREKQDLTKIDFAICWCIDDGLFYIVPIKIVNSSAIGISNTSINAKHKYAPYRENWNQLNEGGK